MTITCLRRDLPAPYSFTLNEAPSKAKLDQNEMPVDLPEELKRDLVAELLAQDWNRYVQPRHYLDAKRGLADTLGLDPDTIALTSGADQAIEGAFLIGGGPGRWARWFEPTYPFIAHAAERTFTKGGGVELGAEIDELIDGAAIDARPRCDMVVLVSPNNPTGGLLPQRAIDAALADSNRLVVLDEAYYDYSGQTEIGRVPKTQNLYVVRSLSKSSIAGVHLGFACAHPDAARAVERMYTAPYHLNGLQLLLARRYAEILPHVQAASARVLEQRAVVMQALIDLSTIEPVPSFANFILFRLDGGAERAAKVVRGLAEAGIRIRNVSSLPGLAGHLRVTIGTEEENSAFISVLRTELALRE